MMGCESNKAKKSNGATKNKNKNKIEYFYILCLDFGVAWKEPLGNGKAVSEPGRLLTVLCFEALHLQFLHANANSCIWAKRGI